MRHIERLLALEDAAQLEHDGAVFFRLTAAEFAEETFSMVLSAGALRGGAPAWYWRFPMKLLKRMLIFRRNSVLPDGPAYSRLFAIFQFAPELDHGPDSPAWVIFESRVPRGLRDNLQRQKDLSAASHAAREAGCEVVATGTRSAAEAELCRNCGCRFGQGSWHVDAS